MNNQLYIETKIVSLSKLLFDLRKGDLQVPPFQRDFVWDRDNIKDLFDSIFHNYPIGSILLWKPYTRPNWQQENKLIGGYKINASNTTDVTYVLDGYQRLSSLFGCLINPSNMNTTQDVNERDNLYNLYLDLKEETFIYIRACVKPQPYQVPVYILMSTSDFRKYCRLYMEPYCTTEQLDMYCNCADAFSKTLVDYKLAVIEITKADISDAVNIFSRINSKGTDISYDWMVNALSFSDDFNFSTEIDNLLDDLAQYHFDTISRNNLFRCYQSAFDDKLYIDQLNIERLATRDNFKDTVRRTTPNIIKSVDFLYNELNVLDYKLLPYNLQLIFIMTFFSKIEHPTEKQLKDLKSWFWKTTYSNYFTIYSLSNQRKAFNQFIKYLNNSCDEILYMDDKNIPFKTQQFPKTLMLSNVRSKALVLFELEYAKRNMNNNQSLAYKNSKIFRCKTSIPENIRVAAINDTDDIFMECDYSLSFDEETIDVILKARRASIISYEKAFVESLGLSYVS